MDPDERKQLDAELRERTIAPKTATAGDEYPETEQRSSSIREDLPLTPAVDLERHIVRIGGEPSIVAWPGAGTRVARQESVTLDTIWDYINPQMLYVRHLGFKGRFQELLAAGDTKAKEMEAQIDALKAECRAGAMNVAIAWRFFEAEAEGNRVRVFGGDDRARPIATFAFPRQRQPDGVSIADLVLPPQRDAQGRTVRRDTIGVFVTTAGGGIRERAEAYKAKGEFLKSYALQALALETAEGAAEWIHARMRALWGFADPPDLSKKEIFQAHYLGKRYSFGYPACPDLESQALLFSLLQPEEIGVELTEGFMMEPEASVSALVFSHPDASYFSVRAGEDA
jgi:5-methyltetrahydrofolate--homocysteine methyltransferase